jgi:hypothetical protein
MSAFEEIAVGGAGSTPAASTNFKLFVFSSLSSTVDFEGHFCT